MKYNCILIINVFSRTFPLVSYKFITYFSFIIIMRAELIIIIFQSYNMNFLPMKYMSRLLFVQSCDSFKHDVINIIKIK